MSHHQFTTCCVALQLNNLQAIGQHMMTHVMLNTPVPHTCEVDLPLVDAVMLRDALKALQRTHPTLLERDERVPEGHDNEYLIGSLRDALAGESDEINKGRAENFVLYSICS
jgi:hypothetical protein